MNHIFNLAILGAFAGMVSVFWTRIIGPDMILFSLGKFLSRHSRDHDQKVADYFMERKIGKSALILEKVSFFLRCVFCVGPWICFAFDVFYILEYHPWWLYATIGVLAGLGMGNVISELIYALRHEKL